MNKIKEKLVAFDLDGTLIDSAKDFHSCLNILVKKHNINQISYEDVRERVSEGSYSLIRYAFDSHEKEQVEDLREELLNLYQENCLEKTTIFEGAEDLINFLNETQINWCIVTNKPRRFAEKIVNHFFPSLERDMLFCPDEFIEPKPSPKGPLLACHETKCKPSSSFFIGDHHIDILAGNKADMQTIAVDYGYRKKDDYIEDWGANYIVSDLKEIINLI